VKGTGGRGPSQPDGSWASSFAVRKSMMGNRSRDTGPELAVRKILHAQGFRYRVNARPVQTLRRTADILFTRRRVAIFIDGCYWHGCPEHYTPPKSNAEFWRNKVETNRARDLETSNLLRADGWTVLRFWTHEEARVIADVIGDVLLRAEE
jgi:DNA mismatch endonuclease (patch repair protein)